jgi:hypothetical protein
MNKSTTDTPRTDAEIWNVVYHHKNEIVVDADFARELELELNELWERFDKQMEAEAEVDRLKNGFQGSCYCCEPVGKMNQKLQAEVERLRSTMRSFILVSPIEFERMEKIEAEVERLTDHLEIKNNKIKALELSLKTFSNWSVTIKQNLLCDPDFIRITKEVLNEDNENQEKLDILREKIK